ncbi:hypothetical protein [Oceanithermus sp.]
MKRAQHLRLAALLLAMAVAAAFAATPAGTVIRNQAAALVEGETYYSNTVETTVLPVCSVSLTPSGTPANPGQATNTTAGGTAYLAYQLTNTGNDNFTFDLAEQQDATSNWTPAATAIYLDVNRNAQVDPGEQQVQQVTLDAGDSAWLVLEVVAPDQGTGDLFITPVATCPQGESDDENYGRVSIVSGPALQVEKTIAPTQARPGDVVHVTLTVRNVGDQATGAAVTLTDDLSGLGAVSYVAGSAAAPKGDVEYSDGSSWSASEPAAVSGVRLVLAGLEVGEEALLEFDLSVNDDATPQFVQNEAVAEGPGGPAQAVATLEVLPGYDLYLGPRGNPRALPGGEGSDDDRQQADLIVDQTYCFEHTLENASTAADTFTLTASGLPANVHGTFNITPTVPLPLPVHLEAGEQLDFLFCVTASELVQPFTVDLVATSEASGNSNHTYDEVSRVFPAGELVLTKAVEPQGTVTAGTELTYRLHFKNGYPVEATNIVVDDWLDGNLEYLSSSPEGEYDAVRHRVRWQMASIPAGGEWQAELRVRVKDGTPDDTLIENRFELQADQTPNTLVSNTTRTPVWSSALLLQKQVNPAAARLGDRLHYTLTISNPSTAALTVTLADKPEPHLAYIAGSASPAEPDQDDGRLIWGNLTVGAGETLTVTYDMRVLAGAPQKLVNVAVAQGVSSSGAAVASSQATASVQSVEGVFLARRATVVGRVFLDANRDGRFDPGRDVPLAGARVLLPDGRQALTDANGNYAFRDLEAGVWQILLDPRTAPFPPLPHPEALGDGYRHRVSAWGLTTSDFPLEAPAGVIKAVRRTTLFLGPLRLDKTIVPLDENRFRVVLHLQSDEALPELTVRDPLPGGGEKTFSYAEFKGDETITYELEGPPALTDPEVRWRYP